MSNTDQKKTFNSKPKIRIAKAIFKNKNGDVIGEYNNEYDRQKTR